MTVALLTAAGIGSRMHLEIPKQFLHVGGRPVIVRTMEAFQRHPQIDAIIVVTLEPWTDTVKAYAVRFGITKLRWIVPGGESGQESIALGLLELEKHCCNSDAVVIHDGNRPLVSEEIISDSLATYRQFGCAVAAMPCVEAVFRSGNGRDSSDFIPREELFRTQTPHTYSLEKLLWAHRKAAENHIKNTAATCVLMNMLGEKIYFSKGSDKNLKLTTQDDLDIFKALIKHGDAEESPVLGGENSGATFARTRRGGVRKYSVIPFARDCAASFREVA